MKTDSAPGETDSAPPMTKGGNAPRRLLTLRLFCRNEFDGNLDDVVMKMRGKAVGFNWFIGCLTTKETVEALSGMMFGDHVSHSGILVQISSSMMKFTFLLKGMNRE